MNEKQQQVYKVVKTKDVVKAMLKCTEKYSKALTNLAK